MIPKTKKFGCVGRGDQTILGFEFVIMYSMFCGVIGLPYRLTSLLMIPFNCWVLFVMNDINTDNNL